MFDYDSGARYGIRKLEDQVESLEARVASLSDMLLDYFAHLKTPPKVVYVIRERGTRKVLCSFFDEHTADKYWTSALLKDNSGKFRKASLLNGYHAYELEGANAWVFDSELPHNPPRHWEK